MTTQYIDMTPTFEEATAICIAVLEGTDNAEARANAKLELMRYGRELDRLAGNHGSAFDPADTDVQEG